jgi:hypothetical protein
MAVRSCWRTPGRRGSGWFVAVFLPIAQIDHTVAGARGTCHRIDQLRESGPMAGEAADITRKRPGRRRRCRRGRIVPGRRYPAAAARPQPAATDSWSAGSARLSALASSQAVSFRAVRFMPPVQGTDGPWAQARRLCQLLIGQLWAEPD